LSKAPDQVFLKAPVACIVEAKNENIRVGYTQCVAEVLAAQILNDRKSYPVSTRLRVVTTGSNWKFFTLKGTTATIDFDEYLITQLEKILGIFVAVLRGIESKSGL
jgi:hypothetical protein